MIVVRHAEKADNGDDPELGPRAANAPNGWRACCGICPIRAVFHSQYRRTAATVEPLCTPLQVPRTRSPPRRQKELAQKIRQQHRLGPSSSSATPTPCRRS
ncbi:MAG: hypothetical protein IPK26_22410 [Planctomycetes bacterium]|nr:hypothetical protein [Planctomycetota bacterium]